MFLRLITLILCLTSFSTWSKGLSPLSFLDPKIQVCYRWMGKWEAKKWMKGQVTMGSIPGNDLLGRAGKKSFGIYCWTNPQGAALGGQEGSFIPELYGRYLVRIELAANALLYNRNQNLYYRNGQITEPRQNETTGVDSAIMYANYQDSGSSWFQEILIKDAAAIKSWTSNSPELRQELNSGVESYLHKTMSRSEMHFFANYCSIDLIPTPQHASFCQRYESILLKNQRFMEGSWANGLIPEVTFHN